MYEQYTDKQIVEMLKPKLTKIMDGMDGILDTALEHSESCRSLIKLIATIYRSAYIRGQLGRSFIIGEKKERDSDITFQVGDSVKLINRKGIDGKYNRYFPSIGTTGKVVELGSDYCFVQWPKGVTVGNGVWACPNHFLEKVTEHWVPATKDNVKAGSKVRMLDEEAHKDNPQWFPVVGVVGIAKNLDYNNCEVQWPKDTTSWNDKWWCNYEHLEVLLCE
jgi:hypothetical protein